MLPAKWKAIPVGGLLRLGSKFDGGYLVTRRSVEASSLLLSMGLNDDWQFEADFLKMNPSARVVCFDHTVNFRFWVLYTMKQAVRLRLVQSFKSLSYKRFFARPNAQHRQIRIGYDVPGGVSVRSLFKEFSDPRVFLKIDIEGSEYRILDEIVDHADRVTGIVIEFHDVDLQRQRIERFVSELDGFSVVFSHANNFGGVDEQGDPLVIELALIRNEYLDAPQPDSVAPQISPNDPAQPEIELVFEPA